jgi:hypothetical protein
MILAETEVQGLSFAQLCVYGEFFPSETSIESVLNRINDSRNRRKICDHSNNVVLRLAHKFGFMRYQSISWSEFLSHATRMNIDTKREDLERINVKALEIICRLSDQDFESLLQNAFVVNWFEATVGDRDSDIRQMIRFASFSQQSLVNRGASHSDYEKYQGLNKATIHLSRYPDYIHAKLCWDEYDREVGSRVLVGDTEIIIVLDFLYKAFKIELEIVSKLKNSFRFFCPECQKNQQVKKVPSIKVCASCLNKQRNKKKEERKLSRTGKWEHRQISKCFKCESEEMSVDTHGICLKCYSSNRRQI